MDYTLLNETQREQISLRKLLDLEAEHFSLDLDVRIALSTGVNNDNVVGAQQQIVLLARQVNLLHAWIFPPDPEAEDVEEDISPNGQEAIEVN